MNNKLKDLDHRFITVLGHENKPELSKKIDNYLNKKFDLGKSALKVNQNFPNFLIKNLKV